MANNPQVAKKTIEILIATERVADQILANKREIVELDKRRQDNREAIRSLEKRKDQEKTWITLGSMLVKMRKERAIGIMNKDQELVEKEITKLRNEQKLLITKQRDLEFEKPIKGYDLKPLSKAEMAGLRANFGN